IRAGTLRVRSSTWAAEVPQARGQGLVRRLGDAGPGQRRARAGEASERIELVPDLPPARTVGDGDPALPRRPSRRARPLAGGAGFPAPPTGIRGLHPAEPGRHRAEDPTMARQDKTSSSTVSEKRQDSVRAVLRVESPDFRAGARIPERHASKP